MANCRWQVPQSPHNWFWLKTARQLLGSTLHEADKHGKLKDTRKPTYKQCYRTELNKGASMTSLAKHLKDQHANLFKEFQEVGDSFPFILTKGLN